MSLQLNPAQEYCDALLSLLDRVPTSTREEISGSSCRFGRPPEGSMPIRPRCHGLRSIGQCIGEASRRTAVAVKVRSRRPADVPPRHAFAAELRLADIPVSAT